MQRIHDNMLEKIERNEGIHGVGVVTSTLIIVSCIRVEWVSEVRVQQGSAQL